MLYWVLVLYCFFSGDCMLRHFRHMLPHLSLNLYGCLLTSILGFEERFSSCIWAMSLMAFKHPLRYTAHDSQNLKISRIFHLNGVPWPGFTNVYDIHFQNSPEAVLTPLQNQFLNLNLHQLYINLHLSSLDWPEVYCSR